MDERYIPVDRDGHTRAPEPPVQYMLRSLLATRIDMDFESTDDEQGVNVYLAQLLCDYGDPRYCMRVGSYVSTYDSAVFERAQHSPSHRFRYQVYKANADYLLMSAGVFQNPEGRSMAGRPPWRRRAPSTFIGRGQSYYAFASAYGQRVFGRTSGVCEVLGQLAAGFERYVDLLARLRGEYFDLVNRLSDGEIFHLQSAAQNRGLATLRDAMLDRYSEYRRDPSPARREALRLACERLRAADPGCDLPDLQ